MQNSIKMDSTFLKGAETLASSPVRYQKESHRKVSGIKAGREDNATDTILNISKEARLKLKNRAEGEETIKKAGVTSARELFEYDAIDRRNHMRGIGGAGYPSGALLKEWMRLDEPETYAKSEALWSMGASYGISTEEGRRLASESSSVRYDWFCRKCFDADGWLKNPVTGSRCVVSALEERYSDAVYNTSVDVYDESFSEQDASLWRFSTKFNVLLPIELLHDLEMLSDAERLSEEKQDQIREKMEKIDSAVNNMKEVEKNYEGDLLYLRFGVKFDQKGNATYHANYTGCENKDGISAESPGELLEKLMKK